MLPLTDQERSRRRSAFSVTISWSKHRHRGHYETVPENIVRRRRWFVAAGTAITWDLWPAAARASGHALEGVGTYYLVGLVVWSAAALCVIATVITFIKPTRTGRTVAIVLSAISAAGGAGVLIVVSGSAALSGVGTVPFLVGVSCGAGAWLRSPASLPHAVDVNALGPCRVSTNHLLGRWILVHVAASGVTALVFRALQPTLAANLTAQLSHGGSPVALAGIYALLAIPKGTAEWLVLRPFQVRPWWIAAIAMPALVLSLFPSAPTNWIASTVAVGLAIGLGQGLLLRGRIPRSTLWWAAVPAAMLSARAVVGQILNAAVEHHNLWIGAVIGLASELVYALVTAAALLSMLRSARRA
jgi:hypothetical protein